MRLSSGRPIAMDPYRSVPIGQECGVHDDDAITEAQGVLLLPSHGPNYYASDAAVWVSRWCRGRTVGSAILYERDDVHCTYKSRRCQRWSDSGEPATRSREGGNFTTAQPSHQHPPRPENPPPRDGQGLVALSRNLSETCQTLP